MASRRPADRKSQIRSAAAALFLERGYHNVSVADVAGSLGITASALYHHYRNKQDLLLCAALDGVDAVGARIAAATSLDEALRALVRSAAARRCLLTGWEREVRYLPGPERAIVKARQAKVAAGLARRLHAARPELGGDDADLIAWAVLGALGACAPEWSGPPSGEELMYRLGSVLAYCELPEPGRPADSGPQVPLTTSPGSQRGLRHRRDQLLAEAIVLFDQRGYQSVTMTDIGAAAGIVASGVYRHFARKVDLLAAAATCGAERIRAGTDLALAAAGSPAEVLGLLLRAHIALSVEHRHLIGILAQESAQLPDKERTALADLQADSLATWVAALGAVVPDRQPDELTLLVRATHSMIYLVARCRCAELWPGLPARLAAMGMTILLSG